MASTPPPPPISAAEFERRYKAGARTMAELDPDFHAWLQRGRSFRRVGYTIMVIGVVVLALLLTLPT